MGALVGFTGERDSKLLARMGDALAHRGDAEILRHEARSASLLYRARDPEERRLSLGCGLYRQGETAVALAGLLTSGPTPPVLPALLARYRERGLDLVDELSGAFVLIIADGGAVHLIRDGAGARSVYWGRCQDRMLFAVEPKGITAAPEFRRRLRPGAVAQYLSFSFVPGRDTMLEDLWELPPGHTVTLEGATAAPPRRYFIFEDSPREAGDDAQWAARLRSLHGESVAARMPADEPVGLYLSGGIDSSVVAVEAARRCRGRLRTFAIHFGREYPHELDYARSVADAVGSDHEEVLIRPRDFLPRLRQMIWHLDEPSGDPITMPNFELSRRVARELRWVFNGEGGDPVFGGPKNIPMLLHHWYGGVDRGPGFRERMYLRSFQRCYDEIDRLLTPELRGCFDSREELEAPLTPLLCGERPTAFLDKLIATNIRLKGAHLILPKVERMTSAWGLTALSPLFDERLIRLSFRMPRQLRLRHGVEKVVLKQAYCDDLPAAVIARPKSGMRVPVHYWFHGELKRYAHSVLSPRSVRRAGIFDSDRVQQLLNYDIDEGRGRYGLRLWMLLVFEIWRRIVIEGEPL